MILTENPVQLRAGVAAADSADPALTSTQVFNPRDQDSVRLRVAVEGSGATATVQLRVYDPVQQSWFDVPSGSLAFTAAGAKELVVTNPGGPLWPKVTAANGSVTGITCSMLAQRTVYR